MPFAQLCFQDVAVWKSREGVWASSPKSCFREMFAAGLIDETETTRFMEMTDRRNEIVHTNKEAVADKIYATLKDGAVLMRKLLDRCQPK